MKNKPQKHKETNVFKFQSFADRLSLIDIRQNALYHIQHVNEEVNVEENETLFHQTYLKWITLNLTEEYKEFQQKIRGIVTLHQILHQKEFLVKLLLERLEKASTLSLQPLLEFVVILAKDLREEFYPYFQPFLNTLIQLLNTKDSEQLEWTFICLAYLFKTLKPFLKKDITVVFDSIMPLLSNRNPEHITNFAAECFSFVARDVKDKSKLLTLILQGLEKHKNGIEGCGRLLFEVMKGVKGNLHSCTEEFLTVLFEGLLNTKHDRSILFDIISNCVENLLHRSSPDSMEVFWNVCIKQQEKNLTKSTETNEAIRQILTFMGQGVEFRHGKYLTETDAVITLLIKLINATDLTEDTYLTASQVVSVMLLSSNLNITQLNASRLIKKVLSIPDRNTFESFVWSIVNYSQFEILVLPEFLRYFEANYSTDRKPIELLTKIILTKSPLSMNGINLSNWKCYPLRLKQDGSSRYIEERILSANSMDIETVLNELIIYPHILKDNHNSNLVERLSTFVHDLCETLNLEDEPLEGKEIDEYLDNRKTIFNLLFIIETLVHIDQSSVLDGEKIIETLLPYGQSAKYAPVLRIIDLVLSSSDQLTLQQNLFEKIQEKLSGNLSSSLHDVRLHTAHILKHFDNIELPGMNIYSLIYKIEEIEPNVQTYRDQLLHLQKFSAELKLFDNIMGQVHQNDPLKYLIGSLYMNFKLLWQPITALIASYSLRLPTNEFWNIFKPKLDEVTLTIRSNDPDSTELNENVSTFISDIVQEQFNNLWISNDRIDYVNYRILLWKAIPSFGQINEIKNRDLVTSLFDFIEIEYRNSFENDAKSWNILKEINNTESDQENRDETIDDKIKEPKKLATQRTLIAMIGIFTNLANPTQIHRQPELYELYLELLCHRNPQIQKLSMDCIMAYKHKYLTPYREHIYGIIDEEKFKDAIQAFKINEEESIVQEEHRANLMPILMRILYSKMIARGQKGQANVRKALVMRFLGGCHQEETFIILRMAFGIYEKYFSENLLEMCEGVMGSLTLESILSPKKLQSSLGLIEIIREQFAGLMNNTFLEYLLKILCIIESFASAVLHRSVEVKPTYVKLFKSLRNDCLQSLTNFFNHFDHYQWSANEIDAIFAIFITPILSKLPSDSIHSPTALLKLICTFGKNSRYFVLLTKYPDNDFTTDRSALRYAIELLLEPKTKPRVCLMIMEMIQNLLSLSDQQPNENGQLIKIQPNNCKEPENKISKEINFGSLLLLPYMSDILDKFKSNLSKRRGLTKRDLQIISRCTELIYDSKTCRTLLELLLPILVRKSHSNVGEEVLTQIVQTISNLFERVERPQDFVRDIAPMFEQITAVGPRKQLCELLHTIGKRADGDENLCRAAEIVSELNAWDRRWVEQPDYEKRLEAYKKIGKLTAEGKVDLNLGLLMIYHSFYFIRHDKDMALRDSAGYHLKKTLPSLARQLKNPVELDYLIGNVVLNLCRRSLNDKNENLRTEGILLLGELARECPDLNPVLQDLNYLTCKNDREIDFFDNITHLQSLRHGKALLRFCSVAKTLEKVPLTRTLTQFILPLTTHYLCTEKYASKAGLITSAIETVGSVCRLLPWHQYEMILKFYLKKMRSNVEYQRQLVRLVMQILDAFHFDLHKANLTTAEMKNNFKEEVKQQSNENGPSLVDESKTVTDDTEKEDEQMEETIIKSDEVPNDEIFNEDDPFKESETVEEEIEEVDEDKDENGIPIGKRIKVCVYDKLTILSHGAAKRLVQTIATGLIPTLNNSIMMISAYESFHKINKKKRKSEREDEEILRVPIALAMVKLLQKLPEGMLGHSLPGIFIKVCMFLKSPLRSVRMATRDVLKKIMLTVGPKYLETLLHHLTALLTRGFQVHVLTVTVYSILDALKTKFKSGDIDPVVQSVLAVCLEDIFGKTAEEKEIHKISSATPEAKPSNKSYLSLHILAVNITESCLLDLLIPFKEYLFRSQSKMVVMKVQECFQKICMGIILNKHISLESLLMLIYGTASESIPDLLPGTPKPVLTESEKEHIRRARPDCFLIPEEPRGRSGAIKKVVKTNVKANAHVMVEFGLEMLHIVLKRGKLLKINYQPFVDPLIPILLDSLKSTHVLVTTYSLKCLSSLWNREMSSKKLEELTPQIVPEIFSVLHKYATTGMSTSNENFGLVKNAFKSMVALLRNVNYFEISEEQFKTLLLYIEQNLYDSNKQTIAFSLLKVIIGRRLLIPQMHDVMRKVSELAIISENSIARLDAKNSMVNYLMDYPLGKKVDTYLSFFISNLNYEVMSGRESAIQIIQAIIKRFPQEVLNSKGGYLFLSLGAQLINDESPECRKLIAEAIESLIVKLDTENRDQIFDILIVLLSDKKPSHKEMAALLCTRFIVAEKNRFSSRIEKIVPVLVSALSMTDTKLPGQFVRITTKDAEETDDPFHEQKLKAKDHQLIQITNTLIKILQNYESSLDSVGQYIDELSYESQRLLSHEHSWVRLNVAKILGIILSRIDVELIGRIIVNGSKELTKIDYLYSNPMEEMRSLCFDLCAQMVPDVTDPDMAQEVCRNLLYVANLLKDTFCDKNPSTQQHDAVDEDENNEHGNRKTINLSWLIRRMRYVVQAEVAKAPHSVVLRTAVFNWIEGLTELISTERLSSVAQWLLTPLVREMSDDDRNIDAKLKRIAIRVGECIKSKIGEDDYNILRTQIQKKLMIRRAERKKLVAQTKVNDPIRAALRKQGEQKRKKLAKKRKLDEAKGRIVPKKKKIKRNFTDNDGDLF